MQAAIYLRVSTGDQEKEGYGLGAQESACLEYAEREGWEVVATYSDAITGTTTERPGLERALEAARQDHFDVLIIYDHTRLGRSVNASSSIRASFREAGVQIAYVRSGGSYDPDSETGVILDSIQDAMSDAELRRIRRRTTEGRYSSVRDGNVMVGSHAPFGYRVVEREGRRTLEVVEREARIVRRIYREAIDGVPFKEIADRLNEEDVPKRGYGADWLSKNVRDFLSSETYIGSWHYGKTRMVHGERVDVPRDEWIEVPVPAIIDEDTFEQAQQVLEANRRMYGANVEHDYLLGGRVHCAVCGKTYYSRTVAKKWSYYVHGTEGGGYSNADSDCPAAQNLSQDDIEDQVKNFLWDFINEPAFFQQRVEEAMERSKAVVESDEAERLQRKADFLEQRRERARTAYTDGAFSLEEYRSQKAKIDADEEAIKDRLAELEAEKQRLAELEELHRPDPGEDWGNVLLAEGDREGYREHQIATTDWPAWIEKLGVQLGVAEDGQIDITMSTLPEQESVLVEGEGVRSDVYSSDKSLRQSVRTTVIFPLTNHAAR